MTTLQRLCNGRTLQIKSNLLNLLTQAYKAQQELKYLLNIVKSCLHSKKKNLKKIYTMLNTKDNYSVNLLNSTFYNQKQSYLHFVKKKIEKNKKKK